MKPFKNFDPTKRLSGFLTILFALVALPLASCGKGPLEAPLSSASETAVETKADDDSSNGPKRIDPRDLIERDGARYTKSGERVYSVVFGPPFPPFSLRDDKQLITGFTVDLLEGIRKSQNIEFIYDSRPWPGIFKYVEDGEFDVLAGSVSMNRKLLDDWSISRPFFKSNISSLSIKNLGINSLDDVISKKLKVSVQKNSNADKIISNRFADKEVYSLKETVYLGVKDVVRESSDAVISDSGPLLFYAEQYKSYSPKVKTLDEFGHHYFGFILKKDRQDDLLKKIDDGLAKMIDSGEYDSIYRKWFNREPDPLPDLKDALEELEKPEDKTN